MIAQGDVCKFYVDDYKLICRAWRKCNSDEKKFEITVKQRKNGKCGKWVQIYHTLSGPMIDSYDVADGFIAGLIGE